MKSRGRERSAKNEVEEEKQKNRWSELMDKQKIAWNDCDE